jgi:hypothetical protein
VGERKRGRLGASDYKAVTIRCNIWKELEVTIAEAATDIPHILIRYVNCYARVPLQSYQAGELKIQLDIGPLHPSSPLLTCVKVIQGS